MYLAANNLSQLIARSPNTQPQHSGSIAAELAWRVLEEIDYGLILVSPLGRLQHANRLARQELDRGGVLRSDADAVCGTGPANHAELLRGISAAARGRRQLLELSAGPQTLPVACVPLCHPQEGESVSVLLMLGRQRGTQNLAATFYARRHGLTSAEEAVLHRLGEGLDVDDIAAANGVRISTIRTHVRSLRDKTGAGSIRALVQQLAALPPVVPLGLGDRAATTAQSRA